MKREQAEKFIKTLCDLIDKKIKSSTPSAPDDSVGNYIYTGKVEEELVRILSNE